MTEDDEGVLKAIFAFTRCKLCNQRFDDAKLARAFWHLGVVGRDPLYAGVCEACAALPDMMDRMSPSLVRQVEDCETQFEAIEVVDCSTFEFDPEELAYWREPRRPGPRLGLV